MKRFLHDAKRADLQLRSEPPVQVLAIELEGDARECDVPLEIGTDGRRDARLCEERRTQVDRDLPDASNEAVHELYGIRIAGPALRAWGRARREL